MFKRLFLFVVIVIIVLSFVLVGRTIAYKPPVDTSAPQEVEAVSFDLNVDQAVEHLSKAVTFKTISTPDNNAVNAEEFKKFHAFLKQVYPTVFEKLTVQKRGAFGFLFKWEGQEKNRKPILLMAHQDVVPIAKNTDHLWEHKPFSGDVDDQFVWGRGSLDDKGSLIAILETVEKLLKDGFTPKRSIYFYFGDNEEIGGATAIETAKVLKDQNIEFEYLIDEGGWLSDDNKAYISIAEKGYLDLNLLTKAKGGHSSMPPTKTAVGQLSTAISKLEKNQFPKRFVETNQLTLNALSPKLSFSEKCIAANMWFFKPVLSYTPLKKYFYDAKLRTTTAPTIFHAGVKSNVLPAQANATINFRILHGDTTESVIDRVKKVINDDEVVVSPDIGWNPSPVSELHSDGYNLIKKIILLIVSPEAIIVPNLLVGATDAGKMASVAENQYRFSCIYFDKTDFARFHGTNERLSKKNVEQLMKFYTLVIKNN